MVNGPGPGGRMSHAATVVGSIFFVFGGQQIGKKISNDMWVIDLDSRMFAHRFSEPF